MRKIKIKKVLFTICFIFCLQNAKGFDTVNEAKAKIANWIDSKTAYECQMSDGSEILIKDFYYKESGISNFVEKADILVGSKKLTCYKLGFKPNQYLILPVTKLKLLVTDESLRGSGNRTVSFSPGDKVGIQNLFSRGINFSTGETNTKSWMTFSVPKEVTKISPTQGNYNPSKTSNTNAQILADGTSLSFKFTYDPDGQVNIVEIASGLLNKTFQITYNSFDLPIVKTHFPSMPGNVTMSNLSVAQATVAEIRLSPSNIQ
jgi:hypothetical protein